MLPRVFSAESVWRTRSCNLLKSALIDAWRKHMISVGIVGLSGSQTDIEFKSYRISFSCTVSFREESIISKLWSAGKEEDSIIGYTNYHSRTGQLELRYATATNSIGIPASDTGITLFHNIVTVSYISVYRGWSPLMITQLIISCDLVINECFYKILVSSIAIDNIYLIASSGCYRMVPTALVVIYSITSCWSNRCACLRIIAMVG